MTLEEGEAKIEISQGVVLKVMTNFNLLRYLVIQVLILDVSGQTDLEIDCWLVFRQSYDKWMYQTIDKSETYARKKNQKDNISFYLIRWGFFVHILLKSLLKIYPQLTNTMKKALQENVICLCRVLLTLCSHNSISESLIGLILSYYFSWPYRLLYNSFK